MAPRQYKIHPLKTKVKKEVVMPGSKSFSNRALVMAALTPGQTVLNGLSKSDDSRVMTEALKKLGIKITEGKNTATIFGNGGHFAPFKGEINVEAAGTAMRFLTALCALVPGEITITGSERMRQRPVGELVTALKSLGADITYLGQDTCPPIKIKGGRVKGGRVKMAGNISSQFFTSLLLIAPVLEKGLKIQVSGRQISRSYIDMTLAGMKEHGVGVKNDNYKNYTINSGSAYRPGQYGIEGDATGANYFLALAALTGSTIRVKNIRPNSSQGDSQFYHILKKMGCAVEKKNKGKWIEATGPDYLRGILIDMENLPDSAQTLAVLAAFSLGTTKITGLSTLKHKETDRLKAVNCELKKMGIESIANDDSIIVQGGDPQPAEIDTYSDHRMAMSFSVAGAKIPGIIINNPEVVSKSFPEFWDLLKSIGIKITTIK